MGEQTIEKKINWNHWGGLSNVHQLQTLGFRAILSPPHVLEESWNQPQFRNTFDLIDQSLSIQTIFIYIFFVSYEDHMNIKYSRTNQLSNSSYCNFWAKVWNCLEIRRLPGTAFKQKIRDLLFRIFDAEDSYVDSPTLLNKLAKQQS